MANVLDKLVRAVSPEAAVRREQARLRLQALDHVHQVMNSGYSESGASKRKNYARGWDSRGGSPKEDILENLPELRQRSRSLYMNDCLGRGAVNRVVENAVGPGLRLRAVPDADFLGISPEAASTWARQIERLWTAWADTRACDAQGLNTMDELDALALLAWLQSGDAFILLQYAPPARGEISGLRLLLLEADRVRTPRGKSDKDGIFDGVEVAGGRVAAYHVTNRHPLAVNALTSLTTSRIPVIGARSGRRNILHLVACERPEQWRGVPFLAPIIEAVKQLGRYREAELAAAVVAAMFTVFVKSDTPQAPLGEGFLDTDKVTANASDADKQYEMGPAAVMGMSPGESIEIANPMRPNAQFDAFVTAMAREIGASLGIPYEVLIQRFNSSFTASRGALMEAWKLFRTWRRRMVRNKKEPVYEEFVVEQLLLGQVTAPGFFDDPLRRRAWLKSEWNGPVQGLLNPVQEVEAAEKRVQSAFSTRAREAAEITGMDIESIIRERGLEEQRCKESGLVMPVPGPTNTGTTVVVEGNGG